MDAVTPISDGRTRSSTARIVLGTLVAVLAIGIGGYLVWDQIPPLDSILDLLASANPGWLLAALAAEVIAVISFSVVQRRLVINLGGDLSRRHAVELTLASGAISSALPAGAALGAGYTFRRFRRAGLRATDAGVTLVASTAMLSGALVLLYLLLTGPTLLDQLSELIGRRHVGALIVLIGAVVLFFIVRSGQPGGSSSRRNPRSVARSTTPAGRAAGWLGQYARTSRATFRSIPATAWRTSSVFAVIKWAADFAVLAAATYAVGAEVDFVALATVYVGIQVLRQVPFTPAVSDSSKPVCWPG